MNWDAFLGNIWAVLMCVQIPFTLMVVGHLFDWWNLPKLRQKK